MPLVLGGAPIGRPDDASPRLAAALAAADVVAAEDTRRLSRLCADLGVRPAGRVVSCFEANEERRLPELLAAVREGRTVLLVTDAGMPTVSDPGFRLVAAAAAEGLPVSCLPGPSAVTTALAVSGLPSDRFCFEGFLPRRPGERRARSPPLRGKNPSKQKRSTGSPLTATAVSTADGPGTAVTRTPAATAAATRR